MESQLVSPISCRSNKLMKFYYINVKTILKDYIFLVSQFTIPSPSHPDMAAPPASFRLSIPSRRGPQVRASTITVRAWVKTS